MGCLLALGEVMRRSRCIVMVVTLWFVCLSAAQAQHRVALVIGNGVYTGEAALPNAVRDAELVAEGFNSLGFRVTLLRNLDHAGLKRALQDFEVKAEGAEVAAIYFAGHGMGVNGTNWLLPVDARLASEKHVDDEAVAHTRFIRAVDSAKGLQIVILDACRNNPFVRRLVQQKTTSERSLTARGLAPIPERDLLPASRLTPPSRLVAFSARDGEEAHDGPPGTNGPYAKALRERMKLQKEVRILFGMVRDDVMEATRNKQQPWEYQSLGGTEFYLGSNPDPTLEQASQEPQPSRSPAPSDECDRLAQPPRSQMGRYPSFAEGVTFDRLDGAAALAACERAAQRYPDEVRFVFLRGRALERLDRYAEASPLYRFAADQGHAGAQTRLAVANHDSNHAEAVRLYRLAANQGYAEAETNLAVLYTLGFGVPKNAAEAARLTRLAADAGWAPAQRNLGFSYEEGRGVAQNDAEAARMYRLAADQGDEVAQYNLGRMHESGRGVPKNINEAVRIYRLAARQGNSNAQNALRRLKQDW